MRFLVGGYTAELDGHATGIGMLRAGAADDVLAGGALASEGDVVAASGSPSWLAPHPGSASLPRGEVVYAAMEGAGTVQAFRRSGERTWMPLGTPVPAGEIVCHVAVAPDGGSLVAVCWGDGTVVRMALDAAGRPSAPVAAEAARDPYAGAAEVEPAAFDAEALLRGHAPEPDEALSDPLLPRDRTSRAHAAAFLPDGRVATTDLGFDLVRIWRRTTTGLQRDHEVVLPRGSGPRHLVVHPSGHLYVVTEHSCEVFVLGPSGTGHWRLVGGVPASPGAALDDAAAELAASRDGEFLYAGLRGSDTIATLRVRGSGDRLETVALVESGVQWPRHHVVARDTLLVAGQRSDSVASLALDLRTGVPGRVRHRLEAPTPSCLLPV